MRWVKDALRQDHPPCHIVPHDYNGWAAYDMLVMMQPVLAARRPVADAVLEVGRA